MTEKAKTYEDELVRVCKRLGLTNNASIDEILATIDALTPPPAEARQPWAPTTYLQTAATFLAEWFPEAPIPATEALALLLIKNPRTPGTVEVCSKCCRRVPVILQTPCTHPNETSPCPLAIALSPQVTPPAEQMCEDGAPHIIRSQVVGVSTGGVIGLPITDMVCTKCLKTERDIKAAYPPTATENGGT